MVLQVFRSVLVKSLLKYGAKLFQFSGIPWPANAWSFCPQAVKNPCLRQPLHPGACILHL
jgi:hypothetical protein